VDLIDSEEEEEVDVMVEEKIENDFLVVSLEAKVMTHGFSSLVAEIQVRI
jgi:hypothetical protein